MELPIAPQTYQPSSEALVRAIKRVDVTLARMAGAETRLDEATVFTNVARPAVHLANFAADVGIVAGGDASATLDAVDAIFAEAGTRCFRLMASATAWDRELAAAAEARGFTLSAPHVVMLLRSYRTPAPLNEALQVIPGRAAYAQLRSFYERMARAEGSDQAIAADLAATQIDHLDEPRVELFLGRLDGQAVGVVSVVTLGQIGVIDHVVTAPEARGQGVATTLLAHAIEHCQRALFEQVILEVDAGDDAARRLYEGLGFTRVAEFHHYERLTTASDA